MRRANKFVLWAAGILGTIFIILLLTLILLPHFITLEPIRQKIIAAISQRIEGQFIFRQVDLSFFPRPRLEIRQVQVSIPEKLNLTAEAILITPQIIPLLQGKVNLSHVSFETPTFTLEFPRESPEKEKSIPLPSAIFHEYIPPLLRLLESEAPKLTLDLERGRVYLRTGTQALFAFEEIQGRIALPPDQLRIDLTCRSNFWAKGSMAARLSTKDSSGTVNIQVNDLNLRELRNSLVLFGIPPLEGSGGNLKIVLEMDPSKALRGNIEASLPSLAFQPGERKLLLKGITMSGAFHTGGTQATFSLTELSLKNSRAKLGGEFSADLSAPDFRLEMSAQDIDVSPIREIMGPWASKTDPWKMIFNIVREGQVPSFFFKAHARSVAELGDLKNITVRGKLVGGRIFLSEGLTGLKDINFDLRQVQGEVLVSRGILEGQNLSAQWEKAEVTKGLLRLGLDRDTPLFHLETLAHSDLLQFPSFLKKIVGDQKFSEELDRFRNLQGRVRGKLILGETLNSIQPRIDIYEFNLSASYDRIPYPLVIESARGDYNGTKIDIQTLNGSLGRSSFKEVSSQITLVQNPRLAISSGNFNLAADEILAWLKSLEKFKAPLGDIHSLKGNVNLSSLNLRGPLTQPDKWDYRLEAAIEALDVRYVPIPYPVQIGKARGTFDGKKLDVQNLDGTVGKSSFSEISAQIDLGDSPDIVVSSGKSSLALGEIYAWLNAIERFEGPLQDIKSLNGFMALSLINLKGPLLNPARWSYRIAGEIENLNLEIALGPGPLAISTATFEADPEQILLRDSQVNFLDTSLKASAAGKGWQEGFRAVEGTFEGNLGPKLIDWVFTRFKIPDDKRLRTPLLISRAHVNWDRNTGISFAGQGQWPKGPAVTLDLRYPPKALLVKQMLIRDDASHADIGLEVNPKELRLEFRGNLERATVDRILLKNEVWEGSIRGDLQAHIFIDDLFRSKAQGKLAGTGFRLALPIGMPLILSSFSLDADQSKIRVQSAALIWEDRPLTADGIIDFSPEAILLDMNVSADGLQAEKVEKILKSEGRKPQSEKNGGTARKGETSAPLETRFPPLRGRIRIESPYLEYERYLFKPLGVEIALDADEDRITVTEANLCGISATGIVKIVSGGIGLDLNLLAQGQELSSSVACLLGDPRPISGSFNLDARIKGEGEPKDLPSSLKGPWQLEAKEGHFYHGSILIQILALLNLTDLIAGDKPDLGKREISYKALQAKGTVGSGKVFIREMDLNTPEMRAFLQGEIDLRNQRIDLVIAIAPLKTVDWIVSRIPFVDYILGGTLVSIPVKVKGDLSDPRIIPLDPAEIGAEFLGGMKRTLKTPFKLIKPIFKDLEKSKTTTP